VSTRLDDPLVDREREIETIERLLARAGNQAGGLLIEGPPGIGKSRLLAFARRHSTGMRVVNARGSEIERDIPFAVARQLLEPVLHSASVRERSELLAGAGSLAERALVDSEADQHASDEPGSATTCSGRISPRCAGWRISPSASMG
jgi:AAA+ ATPase superfamily predicted ATPase